MSLDRRAATIEAGGAMRPDVEAAYPVRTVEAGAATPRVVYDGLVLVPVVRSRPRGRTAAQPGAPRDETPRPATPRPSRG